MILRAFYEMLREAETVVSASRFDSAQHFRSQVDRAMRFVFRPAAAAACEQIAERPESLEAAREQLFAPWPVTWIEWEGCRHAIMWFADDETGRTGGCVAVTHTPGQPVPINILPFRVDLATPRYLVIPDRAHEPFAVASSDALRVAEEMGVPQSIGRTMLAAWALLATRMTASVEADFSRVNKHRGQRGLYPLLGYTHIRLNLDAERAVQNRVKAVSTGQMPLHPVRAHLRLLPTGRVVIVTAHMRGNPERGVKSHHYTVMRAEDLPP